MKHSMRQSLTAVAAGAAIILAGLGVGASRPADPGLGIDERGWVSETVVRGEAPDILRGMMPEVVVEAKVPAALRGEMPAVEVTASGPGLVVGEVLVTAAGPEFELAEVVVLADAPWQLSSVAEVRVAAEMPALAALAIARAAGTTRAN